MAKWIFPDSKPVGNLEEKDAMDTSIQISVEPMRLSDDRTEFYVQIRRGNVVYHTNKYEEKHYNRALYERDMLHYVLIGGPKPDLMNEIYADGE